MQLNEIVTVRDTSRGVYEVNGIHSVPKVDGNKDYEVLKEWLSTNTPEPEFTEQDIINNNLVEFLSSVKSALDETDMVAIRCWKANVPYPAEWQTYTTSLRGLMSSTVAGTLPTKPEYPAGT